jgi:hypothetical protein
LAGNVGKPEVGPKRALGEINGDLPEADFWPEIILGLLKITGQICLNLAFQRSALKSNSLAGNFRL